MRRHGWAKTFYNIKQRCENPKNPKYKNYGGRGIKCLIYPGQLSYLWDRDRADLMEHPSIDRIDPNGHYTKENCRYIEFKENRKRNVRRTCKICGEERDFKCKGAFCESHSYLTRKTKLSLSLYFLYLAGYTHEQVGLLCIKCGLLRKKQDRRLCLNHLRQEYRKNLLRWYRRVVNPNPRIWGKNRL